MVMQRRARGRCERAQWPFWTNPSAMRSCSGPFRQGCSRPREACKVPIDETFGHVASHVAIGIEYRLDDHHSGEVTTMLAEATRLIEGGFQIVHPDEEIIGESPALKEVLRQVEVVAP